ncbi:MAG: hypothetical protein WKI04_03335 [Ferruginibacter sp.]
MKEIDLRKKKIVYIGPVSFHYDKFIINKMADRGAIITSYDLMGLIPDSLGARIINKLQPQNKEKKIQDFYHRVLLKGGHDYVLIRHGYFFDESFLVKLKEINPAARFIFFHWDSLRAEYNYLPLIKYFDKIFSFDVKDAQNNELINYLPLFYLDIYADFRKKDTEGFNQKKYDLLFIGAWRNTERLNLITLTETLCEKAQLRFYHYLYHPLARQIASIRKGVIPRKARSKSLSHEEILRLFSTTNTVIDFPSSFQTGLTIRTFETLAAGKKLITTNKNIINEPFFNPEYINIIDIDNFKLDIDFIKKVPVSSMEETMKNYSIGNYINKLFQ